MQSSIRSLFDSRAANRQEIRWVTEVNNTEPPAGKGARGTPCWSVIPSPPEPRGEVREADFGFVLFPLLFLWNSDAFFMESGLAAWIFIFKMPWLSLSLYNLSIYAACLGSTGALLAWARRALDFYYPRGKFLVFIGLAYVRKVARCLLHRIGQFAWRHWLGKAKVFHKLKRTCS